MADTIEAHAEELAELITAEQGNPGPSCSVPGGCGRVSQVSAEGS